MDSISIMTVLSERLGARGMQVRNLGPQLLVRAAADSTDLHVEFLDQAVLHLRADLGPAPQDEFFLARCARLLAANLYAQASGGGAYGVDSAGHIQLFRYVGLGEGVDYDRLLDVILRLLSSAAGFRELVAPAQLEEWSAS